ncbi:YhgE/Pip domain-containing protein [Oceanobacillus bengalensis]|uniref:YhgE/Pip domain-containing protein n=1 Tax=Oceanobacillus bengalensis TaxID=1435466 RepID=A0A494YT71_9BACI|nr:YhgE/Pip domain-containing protein [Oceanobacillus bengalensis]RKQ13296.1 YhgE/Pip domain-containing protein [Oceanobacillus bengalensis]
MKASLNIFFNDLKNLSKNWVAAILIGGLILLPSLYAWFNIEASWDPYGQTDQIPIGIVNEDEGAIVREQEIHIGEDLVNTLQDNKSMDWQFVNREKALDKLEYGDYFAVIIIPENFSERLGTVISDQPEKADIEYYVNEKVNAIAPKITEKGASVIVEQISSNFISTVNGIIFDVFNDIGIELEENLPDIEKFEDYIFLLEEKLPEIHEILDETIVDAGQADNLIHKAQGLIPRVEEATGSGLQTIDNTTEFLQDAEDRLNEIAPRINEDLAKIQSMLSQTNEFVSNTDSTTIDLTDGSQISDALNGQIDDTLQSIDTIEDALVQLQEQNNANKEQSNEQENNSLEEPNSNQDTINNTLSELESIEQNLRELQEQANAIDSFIEDKQTEVDGLLSGMKERTETVNEQVDAFVKEYKETIEPTVKEEVASAKETLADARSILEEIQSTIPDVENMLSRTDDNLSAGKETLEHVSGEFPYVNDKVNELAERVRNIQGETDINEIIQLLQNDPEAERGFFAEPVVLNENKIFSIPNYGTGMTPFYTVLAIWVGGLLLISLLSTDIHKTEAYTGRQIYFGRLLTFMSIGFFQTLIVTLGNIFLLQVEVKEPFWFVLFGLLCSSIFIIIVYTLVSVFGDVGKALAIILLVLQIAGSGGTYPVVLLPKFFQVINPFLPFTYAIDLMREAVGGIVWDRVFHDVLFILLFGLLALVLGVFLKEAINKSTNKLKQKSKESGLFH